MYSFFERLENLSRFTKDELCDIYVNLNNFELDRRLGGSVEYFKNLPDRNTNRLHKLLRRETKEDIINRYKNKIEQLTTTYERKRYLNVVVLKTYTEQEFLEIWNSIKECYGGKD